MSDYGDGWAEGEADRMQARRMSYLYGEPERRYPPPPFPDALRDGVLPPVRRANEDSHQWEDPPPRGTDQDGLGELLKWMARNARDAQEHYDEGREYVPPGQVDATVEELAELAGMSAYSVRAELGEDGIRSVMAEVSRPDGRMAARMMRVARHGDGSPISGTEAQMRMRELGIAGIGHEPGVTSWP
jgi:hypothetical protein